MSGRPTGAPRTFPQETNKERTPRQFITFSYYKLDPAWRHLPEGEREKGRTEWLEVVKKFGESGTVIVPYSCVGLRADHDILLWRVDYELSRLQQMQAELDKTGLGKYLLPSLTFLSMSKRST
jgi:chlorite dismutase